MIIKIIDDYTITAFVAQLVARKSHNLKVASSILAESNLS